MSLGLVVSEEKMFPQMHTQMPQSDNIISADLHKKDDLVNIAKIALNILSKCHKITYVQSVYPTI